jgi:hypothetical protein
MALRLSLLLFIYLGGLGKHAKGAWLDLALRQYFLEITRHSESMNKITRGLISSFVNLKDIFIGRNRVLLLQIAFPSSTHDFH